MLEDYPLLMAATALADSDGVPVQTVIDRGLNDMMLRLGYRQYVADKRKG